MAISGGSDLDLRRGDVDKKESAQISTSSVNFFFSSSNPQTEPAPLPTSSRISPPPSTDRATPKLSSFREHPNRTLDSCREQAVFDQNPVAIFGVSKVLFLREIFGKNLVTSKPGNAVIGAGCFSVTETSTGPFVAAVEGRRYINRR